jgi:hypothetical protein
MTRATHSISVARLRELAAAGLCGSEIDRLLGTYEGCALKWCRRLGIRLAPGRRTRYVPAWVSWRPEVRP